MNDNESNVLDDNHILKYFQSLKQEDYSMFNKIFKRALKGRSVDQIKFNLTQKFKPKSFESPEDLGISGHFIDVNFNKTNNYLRETASFGKAPKINKDKNQMYFNRKIHNYKFIDETTKISQREYKEMKERRIMYIRSLMKQKLASDPGLYNPNYDVIYKRPVFPIIRRANYPSDIPNIQEQDAKSNEECWKSRNNKKGREDNTKTITNNINNDDIIRANPQSKISEFKLSGNVTQYNQSQSLSPLKERMTNHSMEKKNSNKKKERIMKKEGSKSKSDTSSLMDTIKSKKKNSRQMRMNKSNSMNNQSMNIMKKTSIVNFNKMTGRHDEDNFYFKHNLAPSISYTPNYLFNASHVKTVYFTRVKSFNDIKRYKIGKSLHSYSVDRDYSVFRMNEEKNRKKKIKDIVLRKV